MEKPQNTDINRASPVDAKTAKKARYLIQATTPELHETTLVCRQRKSPVFILLPGNPEAGFFVLTDVTALFLLRIRDRWYILTLCCYVYGFNFGLPAGE